MASVVKKPYSRSLVGHAVSPDQPSVIFLGWPILLDCPAQTHNTLHAVREYPKGLRCTCPRGQQVLQEYRDKEAARVRERRQGVHQPKALMSPRRPVAVPPQPPIARLKGDTPECRITPLGGVTDKYVVDTKFYAEGQGFQRRLDEEVAKRICRRCPVQLACLQAAVEAEEPFGIWGGLTAQERRNPGRVARELRMIAR